MITFQKTYEPNDKGHDFIIGDLHGYYDVLMDKMEENKFDKSVDRLFSVGDLVDRGPKSRECLSLIYEDWFHSVRGNHDQMLIDYMNGIEPTYVISQGPWVRGIEHDYEFQELVKGVDKLLPYVIKINHKDPVYISHAAPRKDWEDLDNITDRDKVALIWSRKEIYEASEGILQHNGVRSYHGHTPVAATVAFHGSENIRWIDTGAVFDGVLTMLEIKETR